MPFRSVEHCRGVSEDRWRLGAHTVCHRRPVTRIGITGRSNLAGKKALSVFTVKLAIAQLFGGSQSATCDLSIIRVYLA